MPANPMNPQPPIVQPGIQPPDEEIRNPGHAHPEREADPEPLPEGDGDELDLPPP
ncbi:hypothetical protein [Fulvimonas soli]|uniref:Uncharacterized protein n=1 Tax=Fulvimonas soli TaxID=155197 RepID=A0A316HMZ7_9GAMM|nr:hypothetical protein [Fulvimonas soli]PWK81526.1 hypothetical protein C7456_1213 [Fulvimonas soli]